MRPPKYCPSGRYQAFGLICNCVFFHGMVMVSGLNCSHLKYGGAGKADMHKAQPRGKSWASHDHACAGSQRQVRGTVTLRRKYVGRLLDADSF
jgi:hypothetical protein